MKKIFLLLLALSACAKSPAPGTSYVSKNLAATLPNFSDTRQESEESLLKTAAMALRAGVGLDAARAERCWKEETARPTLRETCVLLWAGNGQGSSLLESVLLSNRSKILTIALLQRRELMSRIIYADMLLALDTLEKQSPWIRAEFALAWLEARGHPGFAASEALLSRLRPEEGSGPRDLASALKAIRFLRIGAWQETINSYCDSSAFGESRLRCWKMLGALGSAGTNLHHFLPSSADQDWILFSRSFPRQAEKLRPYQR